MPDAFDLRTDTLTAVILDFEKLVKRQSRHFAFRTYSRPEFDNIIARLKALQDTAKKNLVTAIQ